MKIGLIGAGSANMFAAVYLVKNYKGHDLDITIIDKGNSMEDRKDDDLLHGSLGAGLYSDLKMVFSEMDDLNIIKYLGLPEVKSIYKDIQEIITEFHPEPETINVTEPTVFDQKSRSGWGSVAIAQSTTWHLGSPYGKPIGNAIEAFLNENGVKLNFLEEVEFIDGKTVKTDKSEYDFDEVFIALGRAGSKFVTKLLSSNDYTPKKTHLDIGVRFEIEYSEDVKEIADKQYDFKFKENVEGTDLRTFCVCHNSAYVCEENKAGKFIGWNGEGHGIDHPTLQNGLTNFGILANLECDVNETMKQTRNNPVIIKGDAFGFTSSVKTPEGVREISKEEFKVLPAGDELLKFIDSLKPVLNFGENWKAHYPEIKEGSGRIESDQLWTLGDYWLIGDSTPLMHDGGTRGIVPSAASGISAIKELMKGK